MKFSPDLPYVAECGTILAHPELSSVETVLRVECRMTEYGRRVKWTLSHRTPGYVIAGSACRRQDYEVWRVFTYDIQTGTSYGQQFRTLADAEEWLSQRGELAT